MLIHANPFIDEKRVWIYGFSLTVKENNTERHQMKYGNGCKKKQLSVYDDDDMAQSTQHLLHCALCVHPYL